MTTREDPRMIGAGRGNSVPLEATLYAALGDLVVAGWNGVDYEDFREAVIDELHYALKSAEWSEDDLQIRRQYQHSENTSDRAGIIADHVIDGIRDNAVVNRVSHHEGWTAENALSIYTENLCDEAPWVKIYESVKDPLAIDMAKALVDTYLRVQGPKDDAARAETLAV